MSFLALGRPTPKGSGCAHRRKAAKLALRSMLGACLLLWAGADAAIAGSYLARCPIAGGAAGDRLTVSATKPDETGCASLALPIQADSVLTVLRAPRRAVGAPQPQALTVVGTPAKSGFETREVTVEPVSLAAPAPYLVPGADLHAVSSVEPLGPLGRATLDTGGDDTVLDCAPGAEPAGLAFSTARMPPIPGMALRIVHTSDQNFRIVVTALGVPPGREPRMLTKLREAANATEAYVPLPPDLPADTPLDIDVLCPASGGHLALKEIVLEAKTTVPPDRAAWVRDVRHWQDDAADVFTRAQRWGVNRLYVGVPFNESGLADPQELAGFVADASSRGIGVFALLIDSAEARDSERTPLVAAGTALADYNAGVSTEAQIKGVVVEYAPSRLWRYSADPGAEAQAFLDRLQPLKPVLGMPLSAAVPAWFPTDPAIAERWANSLDAMTVVTDKTDPTDIRRSVARFLAWGTRRGRPVEVALEAVPLDDSERGRFVRAESGELWLIPFAGGDVLVLLKESASGLPGLAFQQEEVVPVPAASRSFAGQGTQLRETLSPLGHALGAWPSFAGFAFHGLLGGQR
ncbi:MAG TPA: hypothetical protein VN823_13310 [Stellaceae bacterium]|nr:hypothetical protein [Stellaceae bacterium]